MARRILLNDAPRAGDRSLLRRINSMAAIAAFRENPATVTEVAEKIALSRTATESVIDDLLEIGWIEETIIDQDTPLMGRRPKYFRFRADAGHVVGLDIGTHKVLAIVADLNGQIIALSRASVTAAASPTRRVTVARTVARRALAEAGVQNEHVWMVAAGTSGVIRDGRVQIVGHIPGWAGFDLQGSLRQAFNCPVAIEKDTNLAALAEHRLGVAQGIDNVVHFLSGNRLGIGLIIRGELHRGYAGAAGEIGELPVTGWADAYDHIRAAAKDGLEPDLKVVFGAARAGHQGALAAVDTYTHTLAVGLSAMILAIDPELLVIGGGLSQAGQTLLQPLVRHLESMCLYVPRIEMSHFTDESVAIGAVCLAVDTINMELQRIAEKTSAVPPPTADLMSSLG